MKPNLHLTHHSTEFTKENIETFHLKLSPPKDQYMPDSIPSPYTQLPSFSYVIKII
jgi:hypothetical protein